MTSGGFYSDIFERIEKLNSRERELRAEIAKIREARDDLKSQHYVSYLNLRPKWMGDLPKEFWYPAYKANKLIGDFNPNLTQENAVPPDLVDWQRTGGLKELFFNTVVFLSTVYVSLQIILIFL